MARLVRGQVLQAREYQYVEAARAIGEAFPDRTIDRTLRIREYVEGARTCKLYDFEAGQWLPYSAAG